MKITFVAHDMAPSECFGALDRVLRQHDETVITQTFLGNGKTFSMDDVELEKAMSGCKLVLIGFSSSAVFAENEIRAARMAKRLGVPYGFYMDVPFCHMRARPGAFFEEVAREASLVVGLLPFDLTPVHTVFPKADLGNTGNPMRDKMAFPKHTRKSVRERFAVADDELLILAPGGKFTMANSALWLTILEAAEQLGRKTYIVFMHHPGDPAIHAINKINGAPLNPYREFDRYARGQVNAFYFNTDQVSAVDMVVGADLVVDFTGSVSIAAAYQRIPLVNVLPTIWLRHFEGESGGVPIETVENGAGIGVKTVEPLILAGAMHRLVSSEMHREQLRKAQERAYPLPASPTGSLDKLVAAVKRHCS